MIENGIARFEVAQKIDQGNMVILGAREGAHDEVEVRGGEARPTIRPDHRGIIMRAREVYGKPDRSASTSGPAKQQEREVRKRPAIAKRNQITETPQAFGTAWLRR